MALIAAAWPAHRASILDERWVQEEDPQELGNRSVESALLNIY